MIILHIFSRERLSMIRTGLFILLIVDCAGLAIAQQNNRAKPAVKFTRDIRPILSNHCFKCHGPDAKTRKGDLRLDTKRGALADRDGTKAIIPGKATRSALFHRITSKDNDTRMPPASEKQQLTNKQIELIKLWIDQGATWEEHWAFDPPARPRLPVPKVTSRPRIRNPIDAFIIARLQRAGLELSPRARRETLIRRVTLDLTGIPPSIEELDAFLNDRAPNAYEKVVNRLLSSPAYGERMAWNWLDAARYADTNGFQGDPERTMWPWRDWLIDALNTNKPFNEFTVEMLAGDLLPNATLAQKIATGFNRNHMINGEGGRIAEETRVENVFDRTETTGTIWMGLTLTCCRCHDHKFDPISQREYYSLYAFFNNTSEDGRGRSGAAAPTVRFVPPATQSLITTIDSQIRNRAQSLADIEKRQSPPLASAPPKGKPSNKKSWNSSQNVAETGARPKRCQSIADAG